ncbi:MAG TPA: hypothetical protein VH853_06015 [Polyangia bacterium]|jgi:hypothetical protein|nr:hypothetical protein [Polyangia bacterium]
MTNRFVRAIAAGTMLTMGGQIGCGYILHPERRGIQSGVIDGATMVMDILWLIPGIIPGVVALVVDFSSGGIYASGTRRVALRLSPDGRVALQVPHMARPGRVELRLVTASHEVLAHQTVLVGPGHSKGEWVELQLGAPAKGPVYLEVETESGQSARLASAIDTAPAR